MFREALEAARAAQSAGRWSDAIAGYETAMPLAAREEPVEVPRILLEIGDIHRIRGDHDLAADTYAAAVVIAEAQGEVDAGARAHASLATALLATGAVDEAAGHVESAVRLASASGSACVSVRVALARTQLRAVRGELEAALHSCGEAYEASRAARSAQGLSEAHRWYGILLRDLGRMDDARSHFGAAVEAARAAGLNRLEADAHREWARLHLQDGDPSAALESLNSAHRRYADADACGEAVDLDERLDLLEEDYLSVARAWGDTIDLRGGHQPGHCERVASFAEALARELGVRGRELAWVRIGGYLRDVGTLTVPEAILNRAGALTAEEWSRVQRHTVDGDATVTGLNLPWDIRAMIRSHHERWDGYGYPDGLSGERIPLTARVLCLADVYAALTTDRSFRDAYSREEALRIMDSEAGRTFDPELFVRFRSLVLERAPRARWRSLRQPIRVVGAA